MQFADVACALKTQTAIFGKCSDCLSSRHFGLAIVHSLIQLTFGGGHKSGSGRSADDVGGGTRHINDAGNGGKQDDGFHRQTGGGKEGRGGDGGRTGHADGADGDDHSQHDKEEVKATVAAGQMPLKKRTGSSFPTSLTSAPSTTKSWIAQRI